MVIKEFQLAEDLTLRLRFGTLEFPNLWRAVLTRHMDGGCWRKIWMQDGDSALDAAEAVLFCARYRSDEPILSLTEKQYDEIFDLV